MIRDVTKTKPKNWDDNKRIPDPSDKKPENWDDEPEYIPDSTVKKPDDWDDEWDGDWEAPLIPNPKYKGLYQPKLLDNPNYMGLWEQPLIRNPEYSYDENIYLFKDTGVVGIDVLQVEAGSVFDNILITDDISLAIKRAKNIAKRRNDEEKFKKDEL